MDLNNQFFDEASVAWRLNKIAHKGGAFYIHSNGKKCNTQVCVYPYCKRHKWLIYHGKTSTESKGP